MAERIIQIGIPKAIFDQVREPYEEGDPVTKLVVKEEMVRLAEILQLRGMTSWDDDLSFTLYVDPKLPSDSPERPLELIEIYRDGDGRTGAIDSSSETFRIKVPGGRDN